MNKEKKQVLAFDFGGGSGRAILGTLEDGKIKMEEVHRFSNDSVNSRENAGIIKTARLYNFNR